MGLTGPVIIAQAWSGEASPMGDNAHAVARALKLIRQSILELIIRMLPIIGREHFMGKPFKIRFLSFFFCLLFTHSCPEAL